MGALITAFGLLPLIFSSGVGSEVQRPLAIVVVGGLASSTLLTLIVLPTLYWHMAGRKDVSAVAASGQSNVTGDIGSIAALGCL